MKTFLNIYPNAYSIIEVEISNRLYNNEYIRLRVTIDPLTDIDDMFVECYNNKSEIVSDNIIII